MLESSYDLVEMRNAIESFCSDIEKEFDKISEYPTVHPMITDFHRVGIRMNTDLIRSWLHRLDGVEDLSILTKGGSSRMNAYTVSVHVASELWYVESYNHKTFKPSKLTTIANQAKWMPLQDARTIAHQFECNGYLPKVEAFKGNK